MRAARSLRAFKHRPLLVASGVFALALALLAANPGTKVRGSAASQAPPPLPAIVVAARVIPAGTLIAATDLRTRTVSEAAPAGALLSMGDALGRIAGKNFAAGAPLLADSLRSPEEIGIAARVPFGERAASVQVTEDEIVGGFLQSGDHVDILAIIPGSVFPARDAQDFSDRSRAVLLLQNVLVLAVGDNLAPRGSVQASARTVSLSLPPPDLARLTLALRYGKISLAIRKPGDTALTDAVTAGLDDLITRKAAPPAAAAPAKTSRSRAGIPFYSGTHTGVAAWSGGP